ncbi:Fido domain containing protein [Amanita muscaria]
MIVQYTHQSKVPSEMNLFLDMMKKCLEEKDISPFAAAAWIHMAFGRIHPFTDGNGRVARLLASLPLIQAGYPPINVRVHKREEYLEALFKAQTTLDLQILMDFFASSMLDSIDYIRSLPPTSPEDEQYRFDPDLGITRLCL